MNESQKVISFSFYPSTLERLRDYKKKDLKTWDKVFNELLDIAENELLDIAESKGK